MFRMLDLELNSSENGPIAAATEGFNPTQSYVAMDMVYTSVTTALDASLSRIQTLSGQSVVIPVTDVNARSTIGLFSKINQ